MSLARTRPTSGVMPTRTPGGKIGSAANAGARRQTRRQTRQGNQREGQSKELHERSTGFALRPFNGRPARPFGVAATFSSRLLLAVLTLRQQGRPRIPFPETIRFGRRKWRHFSTRYDRPRGAAADPGCRGASAGTRLAVPSRRPGPVLIAPGLRWSPWDAPARLVWAGPGLSHNLPNVRLFMG